MDILAEVVGDNRNVVIENQLDPSDHDHLGKSIAYASGVDADIIVWIAPQFYDEHRDAIMWLNQNSREAVDLFAIRLEVWRINDSDPAVRLNPIAEPSEWREKAQRSDEELSDMKELQEEFWTEFRDRIKSGCYPLFIERIIDFRLTRCEMFDTASLITTNREQSPSPRKR